MTANSIFRGYSIYRRPEIHTVAHIGGTAHHLIGRLITSGRCPAFRQCKRQSAASYRRKLFILINHTCYCIRINRTEHPVDHHLPNCYLSFVRFSPRLAIDQIRQKISVPFRKIHLGNITPAGLGRPLGHTYFLFQFRPQSR